MKIYLHEINERETELSFNEKDEWVTASVARVDEHFDEKPRVSPDRTVAVQLTLQKVDDVYVVSGHVDTHLELICSRCASSFQLECHPEFSALFCKDPIMSGLGQLQENGPRRVRGQNRGFNRHDFTGENEASYSESKDLDITYLSHEYIDLNDVITEQLQLQVPFQPLCKETCKGMCPRCGTDLNLGRCACAKLEARNPFSVLRDLKQDLK